MHRTSPTKVGDHPGRNRSHRASCTSAWSGLRPLVQQGKPGAYEFVPGSVEQHALKDQIDADRYLESKKATRKKGLGVKLVKLSPSGTSGTA